MTKKPKLKARQLVKKSGKREARQPVPKKAARKPRARKTPPTPATNTEVSSTDAVNAALEEAEEQERIAAERQKRPSENT